MLTDFNNYMLNTYLLVEYFIFITNNCIKNERKEI